ncbi:ubiquitin carboxyl-terminal hydrolase 25 isoform X2 [Hippoglossus hippoglossus]|uniref:ubiquitin carboxyl-terminal hydrolase 25 isoform X2 n=1 Tax=Hippoglossus hippoglossus TaxID=8267 RepID=UPI00148CB248|nr:ubiquitin carboxyl-terminal hydrolase 25 isoform X2 [Hippoglossus hippoglossus]
MPADELRYSVRHGARDVADEGGDLIASCCISRQCTLSRAFSYSGLKYFKFPCEPAMTVEQNVLQQHSQKHQQTLLNQLREITGTTDVQLLQQALQVSNGDLAEAVAFLTEKNAKVPQQDEATYYQTSQVASDRYISVGSQADTNVIDLTGDDKDDLQRAIALSLEESSRAFRETGITDEEQAISRVLEASIAENKASLKRTHTEVWSDSPNPHDRKRIDNCPVGLKNVGNTCWFSAVIQSLFNLLEFQRLVLHYSPPARVHDLPRNQKEHRNLPFMQELRHLFSLMVGSKRKYVDPSRAVEILKDAFKSSESQQQDVSEFTHKLLDWLEDAFQMKAEEDREGEKPKNPMVELFYGRFLAVGVLEGKKFENTEMFGQYPLQVNGFKDLHECLEAAMIEGEIESLHSAENSARSGQEHWFTELPPVLTFELSRFEFNQALGRPEKIHNKLEFPSMLYMDRYMDRNREITRIKREEIRRLKEHLTLLQQRLERYLSYGSGPKRFPLADVLQYAMEFASSKPVCSSPVEDIDSSVPPGGTAGQQLPPPSTAEQESLPPPESSGSASGPPTASTAAQQQRVPIHKPFTQSRLPPDLPMHPAPRHISEEELRVLEGCLHRWRSEVENDTRDLQGSINRIHRTIELMYSDKSMMQVPYRLHAVLVHEGQANAGHYWAYIYDPHQRCWMKYNDISVTKSSWEELVRDSFGGYRNASAYCLMYINDKKPFLIEEEFDKETGQLLSGMDKLPPDLKHYVKEDNELFDKEVEEWDTLQARKAQQEKLAMVAAAAAACAASSNSTTSSSPQPMSTESSPPDNTVAQQEPEYMEQPSPTNDSKHLQEDTERAICRAAAEQEERSPEALLNASVPPPTSPQPEVQVSNPSTPPPDLVMEDESPGQRTVEVAIPNVGTFVIDSEEGGYDDEAMMTPNMQGIIMAIGKSGCIHEKNGPEAAFFKAIKLEYARLLRFAQEDTSLENDYRLQHVIVYFIQNQAPKKILERTLLTQFADRNLAFDERCKSIMNVARAKLDLIKPEEVNMDEYEMWHQDYRNFRETSVFMMTGLELFQKTNYVEALMYLIYAYQYNKELLSKGLYRGHDEELLSYYRRECLLKLNEQAAAMFESGEEPEVTTGLGIMNELVVPCIPLLLVHDTERDLLAVEDMRNRWCSYLGQEMESNLQEKLTDFLPKLLDCSTEIKSFHDPPKLPSYSTLELCERFSRIVAAVSRIPSEGR